MWPVNKSRSHRSVTRSTGLGLEVQITGSWLRVRSQGVDQSLVDLDHPERIEFEYLQHMDVLLDAAWNEFPDPARVRAFHAGGGACALPLAWERKYPKLTQVAVELDPDLTATVTAAANLKRKPRLRLRSGDALEVLGNSGRHHDILVRDAFDGPSTPRKLMGRQWAALASRRLAESGLYLANVGKDASGTAKADIAAAVEAFPHVAVATDPKVWKNARPGNLVLVAWKHMDFPEDEADRAMRRLPLPARLYRQEEVIRWLGGAQPMP